jgi:hypothetical protein
LAAVDFEWTVRRAIIALGTNSNRLIRDEVLNRSHGADDYKDWKFLKEEAFLLRHQVIHGVRGMPSSKKTHKCVEAFLGASQAIGSYAYSNHSPLFGKRLSVRRQPRK